MESRNEIGKLYTATNSENEEKVRKTFLRLTMDNSRKAVITGGSEKLEECSEKEASPSYYRGMNLGEERISTGIRDCNGETLYLGDKVEFYSMMNKICNRHTKRKKGGRDRQAPPFYKVLVPVKHFGIISINDTPSYELVRSWDDSLVVAENSSRPTGPFIIKGDNGRAYDMGLDTEGLAEDSSWCYNWPGISGNMEKYSKIKKIG